MELYGNDWMFVNTNINSNKIDVRLIGQTDGAATLSLVNKAGKILSTISLNTEEEEVYENSFADWNQLAPGKYSVVYKDALKTRSIDVTKGEVYSDNNNWLQAQPVPFKQRLTVNLQAPENGAATLKLVDANGNTLQTKHLTLVENKHYSFSFDVAASMPQGIYYVQYDGNKEHKTISAIKE
ncbi:MAG: hypothetical protein ABJA79_10655, partial [Parafilimonas sp.]